MNIRTKLALSFLLAFVLPFAVIGFSVETSVKTAIQRNIGEHQQIIATEKANTISQILRARIDEARVLAAHPMVVDALRRAGRRYIGRSDGEIRESISRIDRAWIESDRKIPEVDRILTDSLSVFLLRYQERDPGKYGEIFVTDARGATVAMTKPLTDFYQADEGWWIAGCSEGKGNFFVDDRGLDLSVKAVIVGVVAPVIDDGAVIGILKINYRVTDILSVVAPPPGTEGVERTLLVRSQGTIIVTSHGPADWELTAAERVHLDSPHAKWSMHEDVNKVSIMAHAPVEAIILTREIGKETRKGISGELWQPTTWHLFTQLDEEKAFAGVGTVLQILTAAGALLAIGAAALALLVARTLARPILSLREGAEIIGGGNLDHRVGTQARDEIGELSRAFDRMTARLKKTMASRDDLDREMTERKRAEETLREREERLRTLTANLPGGIIRRVLKPDGALHYDFASEGIREVFGIDPQELMADATALKKHIHPDDYERFRERLKRSAESLEDMEIEARVLMPDGQVKWAHSLTRPRRLENGDVVFDGLVLDITERKQAEAARRESEDRLRGAIESLQEGFILYDADDRIVMVNDVYRRINPKAGEFLEKSMRFEDALRVNIERGRIPEAIGREEEFIRERLEQHRNPKGPILRQTDDGSWHIIKETRTPEGGIAFTFTDITELRQTEEALRKNEALLRAVIDYSPAKIHIKDVDGHYVLINKEAERLYGVTNEESRGKTPYDLFPKEVADAFMEHDRAAIVSGKAVEKEEELTSDDGVHTYLTVKFPIYDLGGFSAVGAISTDITELKKAEAELRKLSRAVEQSPASVVITDTDSTIEYANPKFTEITGYSAEEAIGRTPLMLKSGETPAAVYKSLWAAIKSGKGWQGTLRNRRKDGTVCLAGLSIAPITAPDGAVTHFVWAQQDITQRVEDERRLKQAEKMDSLGGLAGGIAHDFNNMLLPILSLTDMTRKSLPEDSRERLRLDKVIEAATRAKDLVTGILAFSRQEDAKQENIDIHAAIHETMDLLRSTLLTTIKIKHRLKRDTGTVFADPAQIASVLLNLASNAADAMDGKTGEITVSLSPVKVGKKKAASIPGLHQGKFAKLAVKDDGHGMDEETLDRVMDPFFTTKPVGEGTGMGLSMVHGIVAKHGGAVNISSAPGKGTMVEVYLPLVEREAGPASRDGDDVSGDVRKSAGSSRQPETAMEKPARKH